MEKKFRRLSFALFVMAVIVFVIAYVFYHYLTPTCFTTVWQPEPGKPYITFLVSILGVLLLLSSMETLLIGKIFWGKEKK